MKFKNFSKVINNQAAEMQKYMLFRTNCEDLWDVYLNSIPEDANPIFREKRTHDCSACRHFIQKFGNIIGIDNDLNIHTVWDIEAEYPYANTVVALREKILSSEITEKYYTPNKLRQCGSGENRALIDDQVIIFEHFHIVIDTAHVCDNYVQRGARSIENKEMLETFMKTATQDAINTVVELIQTNSILSLIHI